MPQLQVKTKSAEQVWKSPDGQRVIHKVVLEYNGQEAIAKTYSRDIATVGWKGTVETYEKAGRNGSETFVKQPPKEDGGGFTSASRTATPGSQGATGRDNNYTMYLSYVKDIAVALINSDKYSLEQLNTIAFEVSEVGEAFYDKRPDNKDSADKTSVDSVFSGSEVLSEEDTPWNPETDETIPIVEDEPPQLPVN